jgi:type II secretory pathway component PulF
MADFSFKAYDQAGSVVQGILTAASLPDVKQQLAKDKLRPVEIKEVKSAATSLQLPFMSKDTVSIGDVEFITAELSLLLASGVKIDKALSVLASAKATGATAILLNNLSTEVRKGVSLSTALEQHSTVFDKLYVNLVRIGESSGNLPEVFSGLAEDLKYRQQLRSKIIQASTYPTVILVVCVLAILFIFNFIVPKLTVMFDSMAELPIYTTALIGISEWVQNYQGLLGILLIVAMVLIRWAAQQGYFDHRFDETILRVPVLGKTIELIERIRFTSSMALMLRAGVKVDLALQLSAGSVKNSTIARNLSVVKDKVRKGDSITLALKQSLLFPELFLSLLEVGEESGNMAPIFTEIAERSRNEFTQWTDKMTSLIEPLMILFMGGLVGSVVVVMMLSIVSVNDVNF